MERDSAADESILRSLTGWLGVPVELERRLSDAQTGSTELAVRARNLSLSLDFRSSDRLAVLEAAHRHAAGRRSRRAGVPLVVVPYMGQKARDFLRSVDLSWMDLSGNADIRGPGLRILIEGQPNRFAAPGRPSTTFSEKAARLSRAMLVAPDRWWHQGELAKAVGVSTGYVSKVVARLLEVELLTHDPAGSVRPRSPGLLLDAWGQTYDFRRHEVLRFHGVGRTGPGVAEALAKRLGGVPGLTWAATGLTAAWTQTHFADHRLVTFYVSHRLLDPESVGLRAVDHGENVWLVVPRDAGVFYASETLSGMPCVHPVQTYLDLQAHPERATEAAEHLRAERLNWRGA